MKQVEKEEGENRSVLDKDDCGQQSRVGRWVD